MNPTGVDLKFLARMRAAMDPVRYARLFGAEFSEDVGVFLPGVLIEAAVNAGVTMLEPEVEKTYVAAVDPMLGGADDFALAIVCVEGRKIVQVYGEAWSRPKTGAMPMNEVARQIAAICGRRYNIRYVYGDRAGGQWVVQAFQQHGIEYRLPRIRRGGSETYVTKSLAYLEAGILFRADAIKILDDEATCRQLRNLEQRGEKVDHPGGAYHDDRSNALCLAATMAAQGLRRGSFAGVSSFTKAASGAFYEGLTTTIRDGVVTRKEPAPQSLRRDRRESYETDHPHTRVERGASPGMSKKKHQAWAGGPTDP